MESVTPPVFSRVFGQRDAVTILARAADALTGEAQMTHAWLLVGPPGSGRSVAARAFAAALQCRQGGCDDCATCRTVLAGTHADVHPVTPAGLSVGVDEMRELVLRASTSPVAGRFQILIIEDADRLTEAASNALLKAIEEPPERTVFLLCAPSVHPDDVPVTIRSRCRLVLLRSPNTHDIAAGLAMRDGVPVETGEWAAAAAQRHVGRALRLATDEQARERRAAVLAIPRTLTDIGACFEAANALIAAAEAEARAEVSILDEKENEELAIALGGGGTGKGSTAATRGTAGIKRELAKKQKSRATRSQRDALDRALVDLAAFYRDVLTVKVGANVPPIHPDMAPVVAAAAAKWTPESVVRRIDAILACQSAIEENVKPRIAVETMFLNLL